VRWVEDVEEVAAAAVAVEAVVGRAGWAVQKLPGRVEIASVPNVGIAYSTWWASHVIRSSAPSAARK